MLKADKNFLEWMENKYPGIGESIHASEEITLPVCALCGSENTASVGCGIVGRSIYLAAATTKFKLIANGPAPGEYYCNTCNKFFNMSKSIKQKPVLGLVPGYKMKDPEVFAAFFRNLTGKDLTPEELVEAMAFMEDSDLQPNDNSTRHD